MTTHATSLVYPARLEVKHDNQQVQVLGGKASQVLIRLAPEAGHEVLADRLLRDSWERDLVTRPKTLQSKVTMLRRALADPSPITSGIGGHALAVGPSDVDARTVLDSVEEASRCSMSAATALRLT